MQLYKARLQNLRLIQNQRQESILRTDMTVMNGNAHLWTITFGEIIKVCLFEINKGFQFRISDWKYEEVASYGSLVGPRAVKTFVMNMTSQNWLTEDDVDRTEWYHEIVISLPKKVHPDFAKSCIIYIDGGGNRPDKIMPGQGSSKCFFI